MAGKVEPVEAGGGEGMILKTKSVLIAVLVLLGTGSVSAQSVRSLVNGGNGLYEDRKYTDAEVKYRKALEKEQGLVQGHFNLGNSLYKQGKYDESVKEYQSAAQAAAGRETKAEAYYNIGNSLVQGQQYQDAVKAYIQSLKLLPNDADTKYNLSYALAKLKEQQQQQQQNKNKQNQDKQQKNDERQQQQKQQQDQQKQEQQQQRERKMSKAEADRILDVLKNNEREVQKKLRTRPTTRVKPEKDW
jgi:Ca-activated chloride channel family protein